VKSHFYRLGAAVLLALCGAMIWAPSHASFAIDTRWIANFNTTTSDPQTTPQAACLEAGQRRMVVSQAEVPANAPWVLNSSSYTAPSTCNFVYSQKFASNVSATGTVSQGATCPANSTLSGGQCTCTAPATQNATNNGCNLPTADDQLCNDAALLDSATFGNRDVQISGNVGTGFACMPTVGVAAGKGCTVAFSRSVSYQKADGTWLSEGSYSRPNGAGACSVSTPDPVKPPAEPDACKGGQPGQVNGVTVCVPFSGQTPTVTDKKTTETTTTPAGTEQKEATSQTTCKDGICTTSTTTNTTIGGTTTTTTNVTTNSKGDHCKGAAGSPECGAGSSFTGDCAAGFNYEGDAIQGAIAKEIHKQNCLMNTPTSESAKYEAAKLKTGDQTTDLPGNETKAITSADIDQTNAIVGGTCIADRTITINLIATTTTVVLPFSSVCPLLEYFRWVLIALGFFIAYRIIGGR